MRLFARDESERLYRADRTWIVRVTIRGRREPRIDVDATATPAERIRGAVWLAGMYQGDWKHWYFKAWGEPG